MKYGKVWIDYDIGDNQKGCFCQVYTDEDMHEEIDYFIIHPWNCDCTNKEEVENFIEEYSKKYN